MIYEFDLAVPANTLASAPVALDMHLTHGIIHKVEVSFAFGCNNLVLVAINDALHQAFPSNPDGQLRGNGWTISMSTWYELEAAPYELTAKGWSPGTAYQHTITIRIGILPREILQPPAESAGFLRRLESLLFGGR